jgi:hypothetical protein
LPTPSTTALPEKTPAPLATGAGAAYGGRAFHIVPVGEVVDAGNSFRRDRHAADGPVAPHDLAASLLRALGVDSAMEVRDAFTRTAPLSTGQVKPALFGGNR